MRPIISVENLSKQYIIGPRASYKTLRETLTSAITFPTKLFRSNGLNRKNTIWALRDISFNLYEGDLLGIIGFNGAGKTTLLKILSRITEPTDGKVRLNGRVSSLLEVGTGFHLELTGRENIFLNGAILGMKKEEIRRKFDEIVAFAEVEKFLDTPVKHYSSGMYMRLAFAVAAHLEPEILVVDEVLAVGDIQFQRKCLGKIGEISKQGRTILFVSDNMAAVEQLCSSVLWMEDGKIKKMGKDVASIIREYAFLPEGDGYPVEWINPAGREYQNDYFIPLRLFISDRDGDKLQMPARNDSEIWINIVGEIGKVDPALYIGLAVYAESGIHLFGSAFTDNRPDSWPAIKTGQNLLRCRLPQHLLNEGVHRIEIHGGLLHKEFYFLPGMKNPTIFLEIKGGLSQSPYWTEKRLGLFAPILEWTN